MNDERGQASVEFIATVLLVGVAFASALAFVPAFDGRPLGAAVAHAIVCAVRGDCGSDSALRGAYGEHDAALVRNHMPNIAYEPGTLTLPVDYRECRSHRCSDAPDRADLDVHRTRAGKQATVFTHVVHRGGSTYVQYWFYYPDSPSTFAGSHAIFKHAITPLTGIRDPGFHRDDWEGYQVRIGADGTETARSTRHKHYTSCKGSPEPLPNWCAHWGRPSGWTRVSRGSHAGFIPQNTPSTGSHERSTTAPGIRLVPVETLNHRGYKPLSKGITPPWRKHVYGDPEADDTN